MSLSLLIQTKKHKELKLFNEEEMLTYLYSVSLLNVEPQYTGARIEDNVVTLDFVKKMMDNFKNQKCLHKRYQLKLSSMFNDAIFVILLLMKMISMRKKS